MDDALTLTALSEATGIEPRTIRSYIERGLLPGAQSRGRGASYPTDHLNRLRVIQGLRRARPTITLGEIRVQLQQLTPEQIRSFAEGSITAFATSEAGAGVDDAGPLSDGDETIATEPDHETGTEALGSIAHLPGAERLVRALQKISGRVPPAALSKSAPWYRISVTEDIELSVRAEFSATQIGAFREIADLLRQILTRVDAMTTESEE